MYFPYFNVLGWILLKSFWKYCLYYFFVWVIVLFIPNARLPILWAEHTSPNTKYSNSMDNNRFFDNLTWAPKGFGSPISPVLLPAAHTACLLDLLCFMPMDFLSGCPMILATPTCWDLQCLLDFTFTASHSSISAPSFKKEQWYKIPRWPQFCLPHVRNTRITLVRLSRSAVSWGRTPALLDHSCINFYTLILGSMSLSNCIAI